MKLIKFVFAIITTPWLGPLGSILFAVGVGLMMPPLQSLATGTVADELRGGILGLYQSVISLSTIFSTALGGVLFAITPITPYWFGGLLAFMTIMPATILLRQSQTSRLPEETIPSR